MAQKFCANCGAENNGTDYCTECGLTNDAVIDDYKGLMDTIKRCIAVISDAEEDDEKETLKNVALLLSDAMIGRE